MKQKCAVSEVTDSDIEGSETLLKVPLLKKKTKSNDGNSQAK